MRYHSSSQIGPELSCFSGRKCLFGALSSSDIDFRARWVANLTMWVTWCDLGLGGLGRSPGPQSDPVGVKWCCPTEGGNQWAHPTASERDRGVGSPVMWPWSVGLTKAWGVVKYTVFCDQSLSSSRSTTWSSHLHPTFSWSFVVVPVRTHFLPETSAGWEFLSLLSFQLTVGVDQDLQVHDNSFICSS